MDRVRFGRAIGYGARHAAKSLAQAVDAATAAAPRSAGETKPVPTQPQKSQPRPTVVQVTRQARVAGKSAWAPVARFSSVLWLQVTGSFFALIALVLGQAVWMRRAVLTAGAASHEAQKLYALVVIFFLFAYFAVSNFVRAARRERR